ncbi:MAG: 3-isopropylmalate dehydratase small subunit [Pseudomonadota bacterium]
MEKFTKLEAIAASLPLLNVDTDMIIPKQYLKTIKRSGLAQGLFYEMRYDEKGKKTPFVLDTPPFDRAQILIVGDNFGCGSSREHAPWALKDFGIRCLIGTSFADIFFNNCRKNGILAVSLPQSEVDALTKAVAATNSHKVEVDLTTRTINTADGSYKVQFEIDPGLRESLLEGLDDIAETLTQIKTIEQFEAAYEKRFPWTAVSP